MLVIYVRRFAKTRENQHWLPNMVLNYYWSPLLMPDVHRLRDHWDFSVRAWLVGSCLSADVELSGVDADRFSSVKFAFYLVRDGETTWRGRYSENSNASFRLEAAGRYSVRAFVKVEGAKSSRSSNEVVFERQRGREADEGRWPDQLPYTQLDYPHQDFAVVSSSESHIAEVEGLKQMSVSLGLTLETWTTQSERLAVIRGHRRSE